MARVDNEWLRQLAGGSGLTALPVPSEAQRRELERVQGMQVRTNAAAIAGQLLAGSGATVAEWRAYAAAVEAYIFGTDDA